MESNPSDLEILRQRIAELEDEKAKLEEVLRVRSEVFEEQIGELKKTNADLIFENFDLKKEVADLKKELGSRIENVETRLAKVEHGSPSKDEPRVTLMVEESAVDTKCVSREGEKKLQRESAVQDVIPDPKPLVSPPRTSETVDIINSSDGAGGGRSQKDIADSNLSCDTKTVNIVHGFSENSEEDSSDSLPPTMNDVNSQTSLNIATEFVQGLLKELLSSDNQLLEHIKFSPPRTLIPGSISIKSLRIHSAKQMLQEIKRS